MKISPLLFPLLLVLILTDNLKIYLIAYMIMTLHELGHFAAAKVIGLKTEKITLLPFGVNLKLKTRVSISLSEEIILYLSGPFVNIILALISILLNNIILYRLNITFFVMNLLPIMPLDGGMIALRLLSYYCGNKTAKRILGTISCVLGLILLAVTVLLLIEGEINISMFTISVLFVGNIFTTKEKYNRDMIHTLTDGHKHSNKVKFTVINDEYSVIDSINEFSPSYTVLAVVTDKNGKFKKILSEKEIIEKYYCQNLTL